ncbi:MAG: response regulator [Opitutaceae bacterium]
MTTDSSFLVTPRILVVDDERQIHASLRLRLAKHYELVCCADAQSALRSLADTRFDLCFVDIHMPEMDGLTFIEAAQRTDPALGYVVLSAFDSSENLRRAIPLQVYDFIGKPLPERNEFEGRIPEWVDRTRAQRRDQALARQAGLISQDLDVARLEREVELVASETARDALLQTANLLTTIHAHLVSAAAVLTVRARTDSTAVPLVRNLEEAKKTADAAASVAAGFFDSAYASRDSSPALIDSGIREAAGIAKRMTQAEASNKEVDFQPFDARLPIRGLSGIDFLLMLVPIIGAALTLTDPKTTVGIRFQRLDRLDVALKDAQLRSYLWVNRKHALVSQSGVLIVVTTSAPALPGAQVEGWLRGEDGPIATVSPRGLLAGLQKCRGLLAASQPPQTKQFSLVLVLPA